MAGTIGAGTTEVGIAGAGVGITGAGITVGGAVVTGMVTDGDGIIIALLMDMPIIDLITEEGQILIDQEFQEEVITHIEITIQGELQLQDAHQMYQDVRQMLIEIIEIPVDVFVVQDQKADIETEIVVHQE